MRVAFTENERFSFVSLVPYLIRLFNREGEGHWREFNFRGSNYIFWTSRFVLFQNFSTVEHFLCNLWYFLMSFEDSRNNGLLKRKFEIVCGCRKILCSSYSIIFVLDIFQFCCFCCESHYQFSSARKYFCAKLCIEKTPELVFDLKFLGEFRRMNFYTMTSSLSSSESLI